MSTPGDVTYGQCTICGGNLTSGHICDPLKLESAGYKRFSGFKAVATVPSTDATPIVSMVLHNGVIYVATAARVYKLVEEELVPA